MNRSFLTLNRPFLTLASALMLLLLSLPLAAAGCTGSAGGGGCLGVATYEPGSGGYDYACVGQSNPNEYCLGLYLGPEAIPSFCVGEYDPRHHAGSSCGGVYGLGQNGIGVCDLEGQTCL